MTVKTIPLGPLETNCYVLSDGGRAVVVDPGGEPGPLLKYLEEQGLEVDAILNTHLHFDHTLGNKALADALEKDILASEDDRPLLDTELGGGGMMGLPEVPAYDFKPLTPGETEFAGMRCRIFATPGHSQGSLTFYFPDAQCAFVGDLVFYRSIGRTDFPGGSLDVLKKSVEENIFTLPPETVLYPGHGPETTVGDEKNHNPFFTGL
ncbi:MBL fold metallo-hydrolase [Desulfovibrio oxyclinae]|jgi:glyoxylase-like metal-dependent hydrolase (beta-lactamase superfamily II)|uniref:MBL fold metallo-hydrolase n=1 Tax=Desulfovibrio oxyclinae TaxID=63560 RepID=UPI00037EFCBE|nr:MBL fold metallo-hydrolase [Desulfovibrio oxyclinae]